VWHPAVSAEVGSINRKPYGSLERWHSRETLLTLSSVNFRRCITLSMGLSWCEAVVKALRVLAGGNGGLIP
jgi:hypothetical protein